MKRNVAIGIQEFNKLREGNYFDFNLYTKKMIKKVSMEIRLRTMW